MQSFLKPGLRYSAPQLLPFGWISGSGDTLVVWRLDGLGRSLPDLVRIVAELEQLGIGFECVTEKIETVSVSGKLVFHVFAALAEFERNLIREGTHAGLAAARTRGRLGGRKPKLNAQQINEIKTLMHDPKIPVTMIARRFKVSRTTIYKVATIQQNQVMQQEE